MRLWSLHPQYLDSTGLVALWRESLLAQKVLQGKTRGYQNHPQLIRFKNVDQPVITVGKYLFHIYEEAERRGYNFNYSKIDSRLNKDENIDKIEITDNQLKYELKHLKKKLKKRAPEKLSKIKNIVLPEPHPSFKVITGDLADWEKIKD